MQCRINSYLRCRVKELKLQEEFLLATKVLKRMGITKDDSYEVRFYVNYELAECYMHLNKYVLAYRFCTKAEELFTKEDDIVTSILYQNYDYKKLMKLKDKLKERIDDGKINCYIG